MRSWSSPSTPPRSVVAWSTTATWSSGPSRRPLTRSPRGSRTQASSRRVAGGWRWPIPPPAAQPGSGRPYSDRDGVRPRMPTTPMPPPGCCAREPATPPARSHPDRSDSRGSRQRTRRARLNPRSPGLEIEPRWKVVNLTLGSVMTDRAGSSLTGRSPGAVPAGARAPRGRRDYICLKRGPSPPSGGSHRMFCSGHFTAQVMQWRQFDALSTIFDRPSGRPGRGRSWCRSSRSPPRSRRTPPGPGSSCAPARPRGGGSR